MIKTFTKDMLVPGKHVVELRNGERYLVVEFDGTINLTNFECYFMDLHRYTGELYLEDGGFNLKSFDVMNVYTLSKIKELGGWIFEDGNLTEIWHREEVFITPDEKAILRNIKGFNYIARTMDGNLYIYKIKPIKEADAYCGGCCHEFKMFNHLFQMVQWSDDEPWKIEDLLKLLEKGGAK